MKKWYIGQYDLNPIGSPMLIDETDPRISAQHLIECDNYDQYNKNTMRIRRRFIQNGKCVFEFVPYQPNDTALQLRKSSKINEIKSAHLNAENQPVEFMGKLIDVDQVSFKRLSAAISAALAAITVSETWSIVWTTHDGSTLSLTSNDMQSMAIAIAERNNQLHIKAKALKDQVKACTTLDAIDQIFW